MKTTKLKFYKILNACLPLATLLAVVIIYAIISKIVGIRLIVPPVSEVAEKFVALFGQREFYRSVGGTVGRAIASYLLAILSAVAVTALTKALPSLRRAFTPLVVLIRILPTMAIILLTLIWFDSVKASILVAYCVIFPMLYTNFCDAIDGVDKELIEMSKVYRVDRKTQALKLYVPQALPTIFTGLKSTVGLNLKLIISAEVLAQTPYSIGIYMQHAKLNLDTAILMAWTVVAIILGGIVEGITAFAEKKAVKGR